MEEKKEIKTSLFKKVFKILIIWFLVFSPALVLWGLINLADDETLPEITELENPKTDLASVVLASDYVTLGKYYHENRTNTHFNNLPKSLVDALIATEDERFFEHSGIDVRALLRVFKGLVSGNLKGGGSTITQQLAKLLFPRKRLNKFEFALRKFKEWIIASKLEKNYTKDEILSMYLNKFDFLNNAVGINSAAQVYFNKLPKELDLHESAMLIGMAKNPSLFNPIRRPDTVLKRRTVVLYQMYKNNYITKEVFDSTKKLELDLDYKKVDHQTGLAPYFREILRLELGKIFSEKDNNDEYSYFKNIDADLAIVVAYGQIIPKEFLSLTKKGFINIHASLLPKWRGAAPIQRSIMNLDKETGVSVMKIAEQLDTGPVCNTYKINLENNLNASDVADKLSLIAAEKILDNMDNILEDKANFIDQDHSNATYASKIQKAEGEINWNDEAKIIIGKINGLYPVPGAFFIYKGERYKILKAEIGNGIGKPGEIVSDYLEIVCGDKKTIKIQEIQRQGKKPQNIGEFMLGSQIKKGAVI